MSSASGWAAGRYRAWRGATGNLPKIGGSFEDWYDAFDSGVQADIRTNMVALKAL